MTVILVNKRFHHDSTSFATDAEYLAMHCRKRWTSFWHWRQSLCSTMHSCNRTVVNVE